jgi:RimJ/RimL family protein N-acetyltransferase
LVEGKNLDVYLETERLVVRRFTADDVESLFGLDCDLEAVRFANMEGKTTSYKEVSGHMLPRLMSHYERGEGYGYWAAVKRDGERFVGWFHLLLDLEGPER